MCNVNAERKLSLKREIFESIPETLKVRLKIIEKEFEVPFVRIEMNARTQSYVSINIETQLHSNSL